MLKPEQIALLEDKVSLWAAAAAHGAMDMRDYNRRAAGALSDALTALTRLSEENARLREALEKLRTTAALLQQHSEGCAINHYGHDCELHGMPGWLADTRKDIDAARAALQGDA